MGLSSQIGEREDNVLCSDVRDMLFGPMEFSRRDLASLNIMRGRDNGLPDYNEVRKCHGLRKLHDWAEINPSLYEENPDLFVNLKDLYEGNLVRQLFLCGPLRNIFTLTKINFLASTKNAS